MTQNHMYRQGDLLFIRVDKIPAKAKKLKHRILAEGEATGHFHQIKKETAFLFESPNGPYEDGNTLFVQAFMESLVEHNEHSAIKLGKGYYKVIRQREYTPRQTGARQPQTRYVKD